MATKKTATIILDGESYVIKKPNFGQLERITLVVAESKATVAAFRIIPIALERAEPKVNFEDLEPDAPELNIAARTILDLCGLLKKEEGAGASPAMGGELGPSAPSSETK